LKNSIRYSPLYLTVIREYPHSTRVMTDLDYYCNEFEKSVVYDSVGVISKIMICNKITNIAEVEETKTNFGLERDLLWMWHNIFWIYDRISQKRFLPKRENYLKKIREVIDNFAKMHAQDASYFLKRCSTSTNESDRLRYSFIYWFLRKDSKFLEMTIRIACDVIDSSLNRERKETIDYKLPCHLLSYSYTLFALYIHSNFDLRKIIKDKAIKIIFDAKQENYFRWLIEPSEIVYNLTDAEEHNFASQLITILHGGAYQLSMRKDLPTDSRIGNCNIERQLIDRSIQFVKFLNITHKDKEERKRHFHSLMAEIYEREAEIRKLKDDPALVLANICYLPAAKEYGKAGNNKKYNENFILFQMNNYFPPDAYAEYHLTIHSPNIFQNGPEESIIDSISRYEDVIPDKVRIRKEVDDDVLTYPLLLSMPHEKLSQHGPASRAYKEEEIKNHLG
jgi:hypothetical protein